MEIKSLEKQRIAADQSAKEKKFWLDQLADLPGKVTFPYTVKKAGPGEGRHDTFEFRFPADVSSRLAEVSNHSDVRLHILLTAGLVLLLHKYNFDNPADLLLGTPIDKQDQEGEFINTVLILRNRLQEHMTFKDLLLQVSRTTLEAAENQNFPVEVMLYHLKIPYRSGDDFPLFDVAILLENIHRKADLGHIHIPWIFSFLRTGSGMAGAVEYPSSLYDRGSLERIAAHLQQVMRVVLADVNVPLSRVEVLSAAEKQQLLVEFNQTQSRQDWPGAKTIHGRFEDQAQRSPREIALSSPLDLGDIYHYLESPGLDLEPHLVSRLETCRFKKNPYLFRSHLELAGQKGDLYLVKTHRHNSVMVNHNTVQLLGLLAGQETLADLYAGLGASRGAGEPGTAAAAQTAAGTRLEFVIFSMKHVDLLEVSFQWNKDPETFVVVPGGMDGFEGFARLVRALYRHHLIELAGPGPGHPAGEAGRFALDPAGFKADGFSAAEISPLEVLDGPARLSAAEVLLLGDTPGMPSTGLLYLGSYLAGNGIKARVRFYDPGWDYASLQENIEELLRQVRPRVVAFSMKWFLYIARVLDMCRVVKEYAARHSLEILVVVGGNTASYYREEIITQPWIDCVIQGDGEEPLLKICRGEDLARVPNCLYKKNGEVLRSPVSYVQDETVSAGIYLAHLEELLLSRRASLMGSFFIYTHKGCAMNCFYCGGCNRAQQRAFQRKGVFRRGVGEVRRDIEAAKPYTSTFQLDFDTPDKQVLEYCRQIWAGIDLSDRFCIFSTLTRPTEALIDLVGKTFKYVYWDFDITTLSGRHRQQLVSLGLVKPQPTDREILDFMERCDRYANIEVRLNLITGLPYFIPGDLEAGEQLLATIMGRYSCFGQLHWARLHAQPGAPIVENPGQYQMYSYATGFDDFLAFSRENFKPGSTYVTIEDLKYPYIYFTDDHLNSRVTNFYLETNKKVDQHAADKKRALLVSAESTYGRLEEESSRLAALLRAKGAGPGVLVALLLERSLDIPAAILGVLKTGAAYLPLDPEFPAARLEYMLTDSGARFLVTVPGLAGTYANLSMGPCELLMIDETSPGSQGLDMPGQGPGSHRRGWSSPATGLAYVIYTSGTTGKPKGVLLTHENLSNYVGWFTGAAGITRADKTILTVSYAFDLGYTSLYPSILQGGQLHILPRETYLVAERLLDYIRQKGITYLKVTPSLFSVIVRSPGFSAVACKTLRLAVVGGEAIEVDALETAHAHCPHLQVMNHYGPTEAAIGCVATLVDFQRFDDYKQHPVIGKPIANTRVYILDLKLKPLPIGVPGELCISGAGLASGYLNHPGLTSSKFINYKLQNTNYHEDSFGLQTMTLFNKKFLRGGPGGAVFSKSAPPGRRRQKIYRTGDLARWLEDGTIEFLGRIDKQVKVRGYRIELGEIESRLLKNSSIESAVVVVKEVPAAGGIDPGSTGEKTICAYFVPRAGTPGRSLPANPAAKAKPAGTVKEPLPGEMNKENLGQVLSLVEEFKKAVEKSRENAAVKSNGRMLSYGSLDRWSTRIAAEIRENYDDTYSLSGRERTRYKRQMLLSGWGPESQEKLKATTVFVAGAGGGGSPTIMQLALLGFGTLKICDFDEIELSNLNRQFIHDEERIGMKKVLSAQLTVQRTNPHVKVIPYTQTLTRENVFELVGDAAVIFDMFDGPADKFILSECAVVKQIPHAVIAMTDLNAYAVVCHSPYTPCYHCIFDKQKLETIVSGMRNYVDNYSKNPLAVAPTSLFVSTGVVVNEVLKILLGFDVPAYNKFFYFNQRGATANLRYTPSYQSMTHLFTEHFRQACKEQGFDWDAGWRGNFLEGLDIGPDPDCPVCGPRGQEKRNALAQRMKEAKAIPVPREPREGLEIENRDKPKRVALVLEPGERLAAGLMAVLKSGKTCVPLDPAGPLEGLSDRLEDSGARLILTGSAQAALAEKLRQKVNKNIRVISIDGFVEEEGSDSPVSPSLETPSAAVAPDPGQAACILYTADSPGPGNPRFNTSLRELYDVLSRGDRPYMPGEEEDSPDSPDSPESPREGTAALAAELRGYLSRDLPAYMIPSYFIPLERIPLTPNGKLDSAALPEPGLKTGGEQDFIAPRNQVEEKLAAIWAGVLGIDQESIGIDTNFFEAGGHSLSAAVMVAKVHKELSLKLSLAEVFEMPVLKEMAALVNAFAWTGNPGLEAGEEEEQITL